MVEEGEAHDTAGCLIIAGDEVLAVKRTKPPGVGLYANLGGHVEAGEHPYETAIREAREEAGITLPIFPSFRKQLEKKEFVLLPRPAAELAYRVEKGKEPPHYHVSHIYTFRISKEKVRQEKSPDRSGHVGWVKISSLNEKNCFPPTLFLLRNLKHGNDAKR
ncbi:NUDIX domain-containing protein [archaeon]|nr:NUDIX domain-containing protein [archaeon]